MPNDRNSEISRWNTKYDYHISEKCLKNSNMLNLLWDVNSPQLNKKSQNLKTYFNQVTHKLSIPNI